MLRVGLVGLGYMGSMHLSNYARLRKEGFPVEVVSICDVDSSKWDGEITRGNIEVKGDSVNFSEFNLYTDMKEMIEKENLDYVDLCLPTFLHAEYAIDAMRRGLHVFCEKPMALSEDECQAMINVAKETNRFLLVGQTLRFFSSYNYVKNKIDNGTYGKCLEASLFRGGTTPDWSWENWLLTKERSGGCLLDQHIHDVDIINWFFGVPKSVNTNGVIVFEGSGYDIVSTNYEYEGMVVNASDNWVINSDEFGFEMRFRFVFEKGSIILENGKLIDYPNGKTGFEAKVDQEDGYYLEIKYFAQCVLDNVDPQGMVPLESVRDTIRIAQAEMSSADTGMPISLDMISHSDLDRKTALLV